MSGNDRGLRISIVDRRHYICGKSFDLRLDARMRRFWATRHLNLVAADGAVIMTDGDMIVAFMRYLVGRYSAFRSLFGLGTYVLPEYRGQGLALRLWAKAIRTHRPGLATIYTTSRGAKRLVARLREKQPSVVFYTASQESS